MSTFYSQFEISATNNAQNTSILLCENGSVIQKLLYNDIQDLIKMITNMLAEHHIENSTCIGVSMQPNPILPAVILGIHKHESAFYCIDINESTSKILKLLKRLNCKWIFNCNSNNEVNDLLNKEATLLEAKTFLNNYKIELWEMNGLKCLKKYQNISYIIQTSGTTGSNKIVEVCHDCIMPNINSLRLIFKIDSTDVIYFGTPLTFDPFVVEMMLALTSGACLLMTPQHIKYDNKSLLVTLFPDKSSYQGVTVMQMPPSTFLRFPDDHVHKIMSGNTCLRILALGGEPFPSKLNFEYKSSNLRVFNLYGITEVSCWASLEELKGQKNVSLGQVLPETVLQIRDEEGNLIEQGSGEIYIGSKTRVCIINDETLPDSDTIVFRKTGDLGRFDEESNNICYIGRTNNTIKRFGHKVNLSEIETTVFEATDLHSFAIWYNSNSKLILFVVLKEDDSKIRAKIIDRLRIKLLHVLPNSSNPDEIILIPSIPLTSNGKVDRNQLQAIAEMRHDFFLRCSPKEIFEILWSKYFGVSNFEINLKKSCSFLSQGGNSILAIQIISEFDSLIPNNSYSNKLMTMLLDPNKTYLDCYNFVQSNHLAKFSQNTNLKRSLEFEESTLEHPLKKNSSYTAQLQITWKYDLGACVDATPTYFQHSEHGDVIAVGSHSHNFVLLNANSGKEISKTILPDAVEGSACVTLCKKFILIGCYDGCLYCINIGNGDIVWQFRTGSIIKSTPVINGDNVIFGSYDKNLYCVNVQDGQLVWKLNLQGSIKSNPLILNNKNFIYISTIQGNCFCICKGNIIWTSNLNSPVFSSGCIINNENIILWADVKGNVHCFDSEKGDKLWTFTAQDSIFSSLVNINNNVLFGCLDHNVYFLECTRNSCQQLYKIDVQAPISTTPCILNYNNRFYFVVAHNKGRLHLFELNDAKLLETIDLPGEIFSSPVLALNKIFVGCRDNNVYCIDLKINYLSKLQCYTY